jgi:hypothetical protein
MPRKLALVALVVVAAACSPGDYDPLDGIEYRRFEDTPSALHAILDEQVAAPRVYAIGEYHQTEAIRGQPTMMRFATEILPLLPAQHLVIETWSDPSCAAADPVQVQIQAVTQRPTTNGIDLVGMLARNHRTYGLPMTCIEHSSMLDAKGRVDFVRLLALVSDKLYEAARELLGDGGDVIVYGGALHNDLYPPWPLDDLAYGHTLARDTSVLEIDVVHPEVVAPIKSLWPEDWFPLVAEATDEAIVWERGAGSYVLILAANM